jgi:hypothetical protein
MQLPFQGLDVILFDDVAQERKLEFLCNGVEIYRWGKEIK